MAPVRTLKVDARAVLAGDGCLLTAGASSLLYPVALALDPRLHSWGVWFFVLGGFVVGPLVAWILHGRRVGLRATLGAVAGYAAAGVTIGVLAVLTVVGAGVAVLASVVALVWLDVDAARDLSPARRRHVRLDIARLVATATIVASSVGLTAMGEAGGERPAVLFLLGAAVVGAVVVTVADAVTRSSERRSRVQLISGA